MKLVRWVYEGERVKGNRVLRVKSWMIEITFGRSLPLYGLSFCNESGACTSGLCRVIRLPSLFRDHLRRISWTNRLRLHTGLPTLEESSLSFGEWMSVLPLEQMLISQSTESDHLWCYDFVYSSHGEPVSSMHR